jgi:hypothetical protein
MKNLPVYVIDQFWRAMDAVPDATFVHVVAFISGVITTLLIFVLLAVL